MTTRALIVVGGGGWGREALEIIPALNPDWERTYIATLGNVWWYERHPLDGTLYMIPQLRPCLPGKNPVTKAHSLFRTLSGIARVLWRVRPHLVLGICSDLSIPVMAIGRLIGCRTYHVESLTRIRKPSRTARILERCRLVDRIFVQSPSLLKTLGRAEHVGGLL